MKLSKNTLTFVNPSSQRPILKNVNDPGLLSRTDENINFADIAETIYDLKEISKSPIFVEAFGIAYTDFKTDLQIADDAIGKAHDLESGLIALHRIYLLSKTVPPTVCASFVMTQLKPFLKAERHKT